MDSPTLSGHLGMVPTDVDTLTFAGNFSYTVVSRIVGWCEYGMFWDEWHGAKTTCPANPDCHDGRPHHLRKRRMWVCTKCRTGYSEKPDVCEHPDYTDTMN